MSVANILCVGHAVQDFIFSVPALPTRGEKYRATRSVAQGGGPAATAAVAMCRLGGGATLAARIGDDSAADLIIDELRDYGVDCHLLLRCTGCSSSISAVMVDSRGERMIVNYLDERLPSDASWLEPLLVGDFAAVLADTRWPEGALCALRYAREAGRYAVLDADRPVPADGALLRVATHVAFSSDGLTDYAREPDPVVALGRVAAQLDAWCAVTVGGAGVYVSRNGQIEHFASTPVTAIDTLGAGDVWHGAFVLALAESSDAEHAVRFASAAVALKVQRPGGRAAVPTRIEVDQFMAVHRP